MRKIAIVAAVLAAGLTSSGIVSAKENAAGKAAVSTLLIERQKQLEAIGRAAGRAAEGAHNSTAWLDALQRNSYKRPCWTC